MPILSDQPDRQEEKKITVQAGAEFLRLFSEQLYASPQKAFEELIANSWDAGATHVDIVIPSSLESPESELMIIDNGESMNLDGLEKLWQVAISPKSGQEISNSGRPHIGKFGIGKLATYVLANELTYVCRDKEGTIRYVTMDYTKFQKDDKTKFVQDIDLRVFKITEEELFSHLTNRQGGENIIRFIKKKNLVNKSDFFDEYNSKQEVVNLPKDDTWTLVILSNLREKGKKLQVGRLRQMLRAAMPLGNSIKIRMLNEEGKGDVLTSTKSDMEILEEWELGVNDLTPDGFEVNMGDTSKTFKILSDKDDKSVYIENMKSIGKITGRFVLYKESVSGGKSDMRGFSNGFFVNILGRVVNLEDNYFGTADMHHATWARFRCTVRADEMGEFLAVSREKLQESDELIIFRSFLERLFKIARSHYGSDTNSELLDITQKWEERVGFIATQPLLHFVQNEIPRANIIRDTLLQSSDKVSPDNWSEKVANNGKDLIKKIKVVAFPPASKEIVKYDIETSSIIINKDHPYVQEFGTGKAEKEILEVVFSAMYLSDIYSLDIGIAPELIEEVMQYREKILSFRAMAKRKNGFHIAELMKKFQSDSSTSGAKIFEETVASAFRCLGFRVESKGKRGEEDSFAQALVLPHIREDKNDGEGGYSFVIEAKTTQSKAVPTNNVHLDSVLRHKTCRSADYAVIVAPAYQAESNHFALRKSLRSDHYSSFLCLTTDQVIELLKITAEYGAIPLNKFRSIFDCDVGESVDNWIQEIKQNQMQENANFSWKDFLEGLKKIEKQKDTILQFSTIVGACVIDHPNVKWEKVRDIARGIEVMVPEYLMVIDDHFRINANVETIAAAICSHIDQITTDKEE